MKTFLKIVGKYQSLIMFAIVQTVCMKVREDINEKEIRKSKE